jgi:hypothetical protein
MKLTDEELAAYRAREIASLDAIEEKLREIADRTHPLIRNGEVVTDPLTGELVPDPTQNTQAVRLLREVAASRARLLGTSPPRVHKITVPAGTPPEEVNRLAAETAIRQLTDEHDTDQAP